MSGERAKSLQGTNEFLHTADKIRLTNITEFCGRKQFIVLYFLDVYQGVWGPSY
jgi:hypothetical protein